MNNIKTIYITTPCFNSVTTLEETINSVITQAGPFEIRYHIQDGGSTDGTQSILERWDRLLSREESPLLCRGVRFSWESGPDNGMYDAINKGFDRMEIPSEAAMAWVNSDDTYTPHTFATVLEVFAQNPTISWMGGMIVLLDDKGCLHPTRHFDYYPRELIKQGCCDGPHWPHMQQNGMFWKRSLWDEAGGLDSRLRFAGDWECWQRFAQYAEFVHIKVTFGTFRVKAGQLSQDSQYILEQESQRTAVERGEAIKLFFSKHLTPPAVLLVSPASPWEEGPRMRIIREQPKHTFVSFQTKRLDIWKELLPSRVRRVAGAIRRLLIRRSDRNGDQ